MESGRFSPDVILFEAMKMIMKVLSILRDVLRGYLSGQPVDDPRPRKGCC